MKAPRFSATLLPAVVACLATALPANAQISPPGGLGGLVGRQQDSSNQPASMSQATFISGKVVLDDGSELTEPVAIQTICGGDRHTRTYTDSHGGFTFQLSDRPPSSEGDLSDGNSGAASRTTASLGDPRDPGSSSMNRTNIQREQSGWRSCEVQAVLGGFSSQLIELASRMNSMGGADVGRITLHRLEHAEGTSISVTSALAPNSARKALEKAREAEKNKKWAAAMQSLQKAVEIYPKYAAAWFEMGRLQMGSNDTAMAKASFQQAVSVDAKYVPPYQGLAQLAFQAQQWPEVLRLSGKMLALDPVSFPAGYFFGAVASYYSSDLDAAEKTARQGIKVDSDRQIAKLRYVLGIILLKKRDYQQAASYFHEYQRMTTEPAELDAASRQLAEIARLSPGADTETSAQAK